MLQLKMMQMVVKTIRLLLQKVSSTVSVNIAELAILKKRERNLLTLLKIHVRKRKILSFGFLFFQMQQQQRHQQHNHHHHLLPTTTPMTTSSIETCSSLAAFVLSISPLDSVSSKEWVRAVFNSSCLAPDSD